MGLWNFLGGNKIGPGHPRYERMVRKQQEFLQRETESMMITIMEHHLPWFLENHPNQDLGLIIQILKRNPTCPRIYEYSNVIYGDKNYQILNWRDAQKWLKEWENPEPEDQSNQREYIEYLEQKINILNQKINELEKNIE